ncbi:M13 family metallopeptidase [Myxococcota bacterium]|nr:M13 family metallopeptidase [Myxococcota bacterium]
MRRRMIALAAVPMALLAGCATTGNGVGTATGKAAIGTWGFDVDGKKADVKPGDDFFRHSGGTWMEKEQMPADRTRWGTFDRLAAKAEADVRAIIEDLAAKKGAPGTIERKIGDYYAAFMDTAAIDAKGFAPAKAAMDAIAAAKTHDEIAMIIGRPDVRVNSPIGAYVGLDEKNPDRYIVNVGHAGLGLPEREYYLKDDPKLAEIRTKYLAHLEKALTIAGEKDAAAKAKAIFDFETEVAKIHWPIAKRRERELTYNLKTKDELKALAPDFPWDAAFGAAGYGSIKEVVVAELDTMAPLGALFKKTPVETLRAYLAYHFLKSNAAVLPKVIDDEIFEFYGRTLNGQPEQKERWKRAVEAVNMSLGEGVGQVYVERHFSGDAKAKMLELVENVRKAYAKRIDASPWMTEPTKVVAREKLTAFRAKIGYPDKWKDYSKLEVTADDAFGNAMRARVFEHQKDVARLDQPTDRDEWFMNPQTVNAYYNPVFNEIVFPAAILQPPFFDPSADPAVNYGGIGGVIGHEMGHGFDDQGAKSDARGVLRNWWSDADVEAFKKLGDALAEQYSTYEPLPGLKLNGRLGLGENIGDNGGLQVAFEAYKIGHADAAVIDGYTGDQRFFHGWAQVWRSLYREQRMRNQVMTGPHSPPEFRVNGVVRNMDAWYEAFGVKEGDKLYLAPDKRVKIW